MGNTINLSKLSNLPFDVSVRRRRNRQDLPTNATNKIVTALASSSSINSNTNNRKSKRSIKKSKQKSQQALCNNKLEFYNRLQSSAAGAELMTCSFGSWCRLQRHICGFSDGADYTSNRQPLLKLNGSPTRADTSEGRYFLCQFSLRSKHELIIHEKERLMSATVYLPRVTSPELNEYLRANHRPGRRHKGSKSARVVAYHDSLIVVQVNSDQHRPFAKLYLIDLTLKTCKGHFIVCRGLRRWYEVYISPNSSNILLRPDARYHFQTAPGYSIQNITCYPPQRKITVKPIPVSLSQCKLTFNSRLGDEHVITATHRFLAVLKIKDWSFVSSHPLTIENASVRQIRSSPSGDYLAVRYSYLVDGCSFNHILVLHYPTFTKALQIDVRGAYWPVSDLVNLQVFPRFSLSERCLVVMKQQSFSRRVFVYKLPRAGVNTLQQLCRQAVLHLVDVGDVCKLPIPDVVKRFIVNRGSV